ncbi:aldehyde dehydrogenase family protein [Mycobacteroides abscessus]
MTEYAVTDPATGDVVATYPTATDAELDAALTAAAENSRTWPTDTTVADRAAQMRRVAQLHTEKREMLADIIVREMGKPRDEALGEIDFCAAIYEYYADNAEKFLADERIELLAGEGTAVIKRFPIGVLLGIMPWNFPYYQVARFACPNLLVGNTIVLKHAPQCPESAEALALLFAEAGLPAGAYLNIRAANEQVAGLIADPRVAGVSFTGSERAGAAVAEIAGRNLKKCVLELGGSDPFLVLSSDDLDATVEAAAAARLDNTGQACNAAKRFIVVDELYDAFVEKFTATLLAAAKAGGATVISAGERRGAFHPPAVITGLTADNPAYGQELFGPVASVYRASSEDQAVAIANDTPFGLGSYVFTTDPEQAQRVANRIEAGMVFVNGVGADGAELPFGGIKRSGFGRELGRFGMEEFVNKKLIRTL